MNIAVSNLNRRCGINKRFAGKIARDILKIINQEDAAIEIIFLSDEAIRPINKRYKGRDRATDVLSFDLDSCGQLLISSDMAMKNSRVYKTPFEKELILYIIHGILHLFGYDDDKPKDRARMSKKQDSILEILCAKANLSKVLTRR